MGPDWPGWIWGGIGLVGSGAGLAWLDLGRDWPGWIWDRIGLVGSGAGLAWLDLRPNEHGWMGGKLDLRNVAQNGGRTGDISVGTLYVTRHRISIGLVSDQALSQG